MPDDLTADAEVGDEDRDIAHISQQRTNGVGVLFQAGVLFSTGSAKGTALSKVYSDQI